MKKLVIAISCLFVCSVGLFAQASATLNGRVIDQGGAAVPNASVTVTSPGTGAVRQTVTNGEGLYSIPALVPGNYNLKADYTGFSPAEKQNVELLTGANLTVDLQLSVSGVKEAVSVEASAALVETTQATQGASIRQNEVSELPMLNRSMSALMSLIPGAREVTGAVTAHGTSSNYVSVGGGAGQNYDNLVDGIENKEDQCGGTFMNYSLEGVQEFKTMTNGANAEYGRGTAQVLLATKSGTNQLHGSGFGYYRNQDLIRTDYLSDPAHGGLGKPPFSRDQYGGSVGGRIIKDKLWFFGSVEYISQDFSIPRPQSYINQLGILAAALPNLGVLASGSVPEPSRDLLDLVKFNWQPTQAHSVFLRWSGESSYVINDSASNTAGLLSWENGVEDKNIQFLMNAGVGDAWVINPTTVNQFVAQWMSFKHDNQYPVCPASVLAANPNLGVDACLASHLSFGLGTNVSTGIANAYPHWYTEERKWEWRDDLSKQMGRHSLKFGVDYIYLPAYGGFFAGGSPGTITFTDAPDVIASNHTKYPQGFATPGAVFSLAEYSAADYGANVGTYFSKNNYDLAVYGQDDFKVSSRLTINYGIRYDIYSLLNSKANLATNPIYQALKGVGSPFGVVPNFPSKGDIQPRIGIAWDPRGNGKDVIRASYGMFYIEQLKNTSYQQEYLQAPQTGLYYKQTFTNSGPGSFLSTYAYGVTPLPSLPPASKTLPLVAQLNLTGYWYDPLHDKDGRTDQFHVGWSHILPGSSVISVDHTVILLHNGWRPLDINPKIGGVRPLEASFENVLHLPVNAVGPIYIESAQDHAFYDETAVHFERRFSKRGSFQVNYVLAWSNGMGGTADGAIRSAAIYPQVATATGGNIFGPTEYGPTAYDERHRITAVGVLNLPFKIELAPSLTWATARPYTLYRGANPAGEGNLYVLDANGVPVGPDSQRGEALFMLSTRVTRNFRFGHDGRFNVAAFGELYNLTDRANFGNVYQGLATATNYKQPTGFLGGIGAVSSIPNSFQVQFGGRFSF